MLDPRATAGGDESLPIRRRAPMPLVRQRCDAVPCTRQGATSQRASSRSPFGPARRERRSSPRRAAPFARWRPKSLSNAGLTPKRPTHREHLTEARHSTGGAIGIASALREHRPEPRRNDLSARARTHHRRGNEGPWTRISTTNRRSPLPPGRAEGSPVTEMQAPPSPWPTPIRRRALAAIFQQSTPPNTQGVRERRASVPTARSIERLRSSRHDRRRARSAGSLTRRRVVAQTRARSRRFATPPLGFVAFRRNQRRRSLSCRFTSPTPSAPRVSHSLSGLIPPAPRGFISRHIRP